MPTPAPQHWAASAPTTAAAKAAPRHQNSTARPNAGTTNSNGLPQNPLNRFGTGPLSSGSRRNHPDGGNPQQPCNTPGSEHWKAWESTPLRRRARTPHLATTGDPPKEPYAAQGSQPARVSRRGPQQQCRQPTSSQVEAGIDGWLPAAMDHPPLDSPAPSPHAPWRVAKPTPPARRCFTCNHSNAQPKIPICCCTSPRWSGCSTPIPIRCDCCACSV